MPHTYSIQTWLTTSHLNIFLNFILKNVLKFSIHTKMQLTNNYISVFSFLKDMFISARNNNELWHL